jgi:hypothetical protein
MTADVYLIRSLDPIVKLMIIPKTLVTRTPGSKHSLSRSLKKALAAD